MNANAEIIDQKNVHEALEKALWLLCEYGLIGMLQAASIQEKIDTMRQFSERG